LILFLAISSWGKHMQMNRFKTFFGIFLIFACGMAAGAGGMRYYVKQQIDHFTASGPPVARLLMRPDIVRDLGLTDAQHEKITSIQTRIEEDIQAFKQAHHPELIGIIDRGFVEINELLDADQQARFADIHNKMKHRWEQGRRPCGKRPFQIPRVLSIVEISRRLNLSPEQTEKIQPILNTLLEKYQQDAGRIHERPRQSGHPLRADIRSIEQEAIKRIQPFLTPVQQNILTSMMSDQAHRKQYEKYDNP
jgi:hypothetical protein